MFRRPARYLGANRLMNLILKNMIAGMGTILVIAPHGSNAQEIDPNDHMRHKTDVDALRADWDQIGNDLMIASSKKIESQEKS